MSAPLPYNVLLRWIQDESCNYYQTVELLRQIYTTFATVQPYPLDSLKDNARHHCFLIVSENEESHIVAAILHHMTQYPSRIGVTIPFDK